MTKGDQARNASSAHTASRRAAGRLSVVPAARNDSLRTRTSSTPAHAINQFTTISIQDLFRAASAERGLNRWKTGLPPHGGSGKACACQWSQLKLLRRPSPATSALANRHSKVARRHSNITGALQLPNLHIIHEPHGKSTGFAPKPTNMGKLRGFILRRPE